MADYFAPFMVNHPAEDSCLYVHLADEKDAIMIDCGANNRLPLRLLQKVSMVFISHTHVDHFIGFDNLIRSNVRLNKTISVYGPPGITDQVHHKLLSYTWNLLLEDAMEVRVFEILGDHIAVTMLSYKNAFQKSYPLAIQPIHDRIIYENGDMYIRYAALNHKIPCLGYALVAKKTWRVDKDKLEQFARQPGPWIKELKTLLANSAPLTSVINVGGEPFTLADLNARLLVEVPEQKIAYVTDTLYTAATEAAIVELAGGADLFFCEAHFTEDEATNALATCHLTARQSGIVARKAGVKQVVSFHHSPRYLQGKPGTLESEFQETFTGKGAKS